MGECLIASTASSMSHRCSCTWWTIAIGFGEDGNVALRAGQRSRPAHDRALAAISARARHVRLRATVTGRADGARVVEALPPAGNCGQGTCTGRRLVRHGRESLQPLGYAVSLVVSFVVQPPP